MSTIVAGTFQGSGFDVSLDIADYQHLAFVNGNSTSLTYTFAPAEPIAVQFFGSGFNPGASGDVTTGTLDRILETSNGQLFVDASGFSIPVPQFFDWVNTGNAEAAREAILGGADNVTGSPLSDILFSLSGDDSIFGGAGNDGLAGQEGNDFLNGGDGADTASYEHGRFEGRSASFDGLEYIASYNDLMNGYGTNGDAGSVHYIDHGRFEGRASSFDGLQYIASYADLITGFGPNSDVGTTHYVLHGRFEGRMATFDAAQYLANYADLQAGYGTDLEAATVHYIAHGYYEGRTDHPI